MTIPKPFFPLLVVLLLGAAWLLSSPAASGDHPSPLTVAKASFTTYEHAPAPNTGVVVWVGTPADIPDLKLVPDVLIRTNGFHAPGDGGAAEYLVVADTTGLGLTPANPGLLPLANDNWALLQPKDGAVNIRAFGARGDSVSVDRDPFNDAVQFLTAVQQGGKLIVPPGRYSMGTEFNEPFVLESNITVEGSGDGRSVLIRPPADHSTEVLRILRKENVTLRNLTLVSYADKEFLRILYAENARDIHIERCSLLNGVRPVWGWTPTAVSANGIHHITIKDSYIKWSQLKFGGGEGPAYDVRIEDCYFFEPTNFAASAVNPNTTNFNVAEFYFINNTVNGVRGQGGVFLGRDGEPAALADTLRNVFITGNAFLNVDPRPHNATNVIYIIQNRFNENIVISGNSIKLREGLDTDKALGIVFRPGSNPNTFTKNLIVSNNMVSEIGLYGILVSLQGTAVIEGNSMFDNRGMFLEVLGNSDVNVYGNIIDDGELEIRANIDANARVNIFGNKLLQQEPFNPAVNVLVPQAASRLFLRLENNNLFNDSGDLIQFSNRTGEVNAYIFNNFTNVPETRFVGNAAPSIVIGHNHFNNTFQPAAGGAPLIAPRDAPGSVAEKVLRLEEGRWIGRQQEQQTVRITTDADGYARIRFRNPFSEPPANIRIEEMISGSDGYFNVVIRDGTVTPTSFDVIVFDGAGRPLSRQEGIKFQYTAGQ